MKCKTNCDYCINYIYDEDYDCHECHVNLDQDEMLKFLSNSFDNCPYFRLNDEYTTVKRQM